MKALNEDERVLTMKSTYVRLYNILITIIGNVDFKLYSMQVKTDKTLKKIF